MEKIAAGERFNVMVGNPPIVDTVGPIPEELQTKIEFAAGLSAATKEPDAAKLSSAF